MSGFPALNKAKDDEKMNKLKRMLRDNMNVIMSSLCLSFTFFVCGPIQMYLISVDELWFTLGNILLVCLLVGLIAFIVFAGIGIVLPQKIASYYSAVLWGLSVALYIQANFIPNDYGVLDGGEIDWSSYTGTMVFNSAFWLACILLPLLLQWKKTALVRKMILPVSSVLLAIQGVSLIVLLFTNYPAWSVKNGYLTDSGLYDVSEDENVTLFVLDTFDQNFFEEIYQNEPSYLEPLDGFTYFDNATCAFSTTVPSMPYIMTGQIYKNDIPFKDFLEQAYKSTPYYDDLQKAGYTINLYTFDEFMPSYAGDFVNNYASGQSAVSSRFGLAKTLYKFVSFRYFPHFMKQWVWLYSGEFDQWKKEAFINENGGFYQHLQETGLQSVNGKVYNLIHLQGVHLPYQYDEDLNVVTDGSATEYSVSKGVLKIVYKYIEELKRLNVYDNTTIIVMADHGKVAGEPSSPLLMVKPRNATGTIEKNSAPVVQGDVLATVMNDLGLNEQGQYGRSVFEIQEGEQRERNYYFYSLDWDNEPGYLPQLIGYTISPSGNDLEDFRLTNYTAGQYTLGDIIDCRESSSGFNIQTYGLHGFSPTENYTWTTANEFMMAVELTQKPQKDILVSVDLHSVYSPPQQVLISVNGQTVLETTVSEPGVLQFLVPQNLAQADKLEFTFNIPNARSPKELGASEDIRKIGLGISQIVMEEENLSELEKVAIEEQAEPYYFGNEIVFSAGADGTKYFSNGLYAAEAGFAWTQGTQGQMRLVVGETTDDLQAVINVSGIIGDSQSLTISAQGEMLLDTILSPGEQELRLSIPQECVVDGVLVLDFAYPDAVSPQSIDPQSTDTRVLGIRLTSMTIAD